MSHHVLVTGGAGYIGSHLCKALASQGYIPVTYDSLETGHLSSVRFGPFIKGNILDGPLLVSTLKTFQPLAIFHLAASSDARASVLKASSYYKNNLTGTLTLLESLLEYPSPYFIFSSSASVYGQGKNSPLKEDAALSPLNPYGKTKLSAERMIANFCFKQNIHYANLRYFNAAGADLEGELGESHTPETHLIPLLIEVLKKEKESFPLFTNKHPTHDGTAVRDFIHVSDLADAHIEVLNWLKYHKKSITLNLGSGVGHTILDILKELEIRTNKKIPIQTTAPIQEASCLIADMTLAKSLLNWSPKNSSLTTILETALRWHR